MMTTPATPPEAADGVGPSWTLIGEIRGYTFPVCPDCGSWTVIYSKQEGADYCVACGWMAAPRAGDE
jgi:predicted RNA-binding Zn-ribbon protein involved in translation (DUF1610 family)